MSEEALDLRSLALLPSQPALSNRGLCSTKESIRVFGSASFFDRTNSLFPDGFQVVLGGFPARRSDNCAITLNKEKEKKGNKTLTYYLIYISCIENILLLEELSYCKP